jgi:hypothetical protein
MWRRISWKLEVTNVTAFNVTRPNAKAICTARNTRGSHFTEHGVSVQLRWARNVARRGILLAHYEIVMNEAINLTITKDGNDAHMWGHIATRQSATAQMMVGPWYSMQPRLNSRHVLLATFRRRTRSADSTFSCRIWTFTLSYYHVYLAQLQSESMGPGDCYVLQSSTITTAPACQATGQQASKTDHSHPLSADVRKRGSIHGLHGVELSYTEGQLDPPLQPGKQAALTSGIAHYLPSVHIRIPGLGQSAWLQIQRSGFDSPRYYIFWEVVGLERGPLSLVSITEEQFERKSSGSGLESREYESEDPLRWPCGTLYPQTVALTSPTSGGR